MRGVFAGTEVQIGRCLREALEFGQSESREQRNCPDVVNGQHDSAKGRRGNHRNQRLHT
jgi:hypothetical protein